jgi:PHD/YefM family antitoxin component YafN of YafNO toxin-antitoxin module
MKALVLKDEQFVTDHRGKPVGVLLDMKTYEHLREAEEELADIHAYDAARSKVAADIKAGRTASLEDYRAKRAARVK